MPKTWIDALGAYNYPVTLSNYSRAGEFPNHFTQTIAGRRPSTIEFEDYFRANSENTIEPYFEVVFWNLYSQRKRFEDTVDRIVDYVRQNGVAASELRSAVDSFVQKPTKPNLRVLRAGLGLRAPVLAVALTFPAFVDPTRFPMIDMQTAKWITSNYSKQNQNRRNHLTPFKLSGTSVQDNDFQNYLNWVEWCRESARVLTQKTDKEWRARDVEMAVFAAAPRKGKKGMGLNPLP